MGKALLFIEYGAQEWRVFGEDRGEVIGFGSKDLRG